MNDDRADQESFPIESGERENRSDRVFRALVENSPDLIARFDRDLRRQYVNPAIERQTGLPASELIGKTLRELNFDPRFSDRIERALGEVFDSGNEQTLEVRLPGPDGERIFHLRIVPERGEDERVEFALVISRDITAIRRDQDRLRLLTREVELLLESTYEGICATDTGGRCTLVNASAASMLGYTTEEMMGQSVHGLVHRDCGVEECELAEAMKAGTSSHIVDETLKRKNGASLPVEIFTSPIRADDGTLRGVVLSFIDVTERQQLQSELERANRLIGLGRVASAMSHEFNNVLMGIQPYAEVILRSSTEPRVTSAANRIVEAVNRGRGVTEEIRVFMSPLPPVLSKMDAGIWLSELIGELGGLLPPSIRFVPEIAEEAMPVEIDREQLEQVLRSIVLNARESLGNEAGIVRLQAGLTADPARLRSEEPFVRVSLSDSGPGIDAGRLPMIFDPFYTTKETGKGLGLAIARRIVALHHGHLHVESEAGTGTTVDIFLPRADKGGTTQNGPEARTNELRRWPSEILLVEDDEAVAAGLLMLLEEEGFVVHLATDGARTLELLARVQPQALVIDVKLPDCNGFDLYDQITEAHGPLPVIFASGHADGARLETLHSTAEIRLLEKPFTIETLLHELESLEPDASEG